MEALAVGIALLALIGSGVAFLIGDARNKGRLDTLAPKVEALEHDAKATSKAIAESSIDRVGLHKEIDRLDREKAGRDIVEGVGALLRDLKVDMERSLREMKNDIDRRFDRLDRQRDDE